MSEPSDTSPAEKRVSPWLWVLTGAILIAVLAVTASLMLRLQNPEGDHASAAPSAQADGG